MHPTTQRGRRAAIMNAAYRVRLCCRAHQRAARERAIHALGLAVREAFDASDDFEPLLVAIVDGLNPRDERARF